MAGSPGEFGVTRGTGGILTSTQIAHGGCPVGRPSVVTSTARPENSRQPATISSAGAYRLSLTYFEVAVRLVRRTISCGVECDFDRSLDFEEEIE